MSKHERPQLEAGGAVEGPWYDHSTAPGDPSPTVSKPETVALPEALAALMAILLRLANALDRQAENRPGIEPLVYRFDELADALRISRRALERERAAGRFPRPDAIVGRMPLWKPETIRQWLDRGGSRS